MEEYYDAHDKAKATGYFNSKVWDSEISKLERKWRNDPGMMDYYRANTNIGAEDIPESLLTSLPYWDKVRMQRSIEARKRRRELLEQGMSMVSR